jgi:hypothetical protein
MALNNPSVIVGLGAGAAKWDHGRLPIWLPGSRALATMHPSALLRMTDPKQQSQAFDILAADLKAAREL